MTYTAQAVYKPHAKRPYRLQICPWRDGRKHTHELIGVVHDTHDNETRWLFWCNTSDAFVLAIPDDIPARTAQANAPAWWARAGAPAK